MTPAERYWAKQARTRTNVAATLLCVLPILFVVLR